MYTGLGVAPAVAAKVSIDIGQKLSQLFGHQADRVKKRTDEILAQFNRATPPSSDPAALEWLYVKSGGRDPHGAAKYDMNKIKGWRPSDVPGSVGSLVQSFSYASQLRSLSYDLYVTAAESQGKEPLPPNEHLTKVLFPNIGVDSTTGAPIVPTLERLKQQAADAQPKVQQAGFLGMDLGSPTVLASLGFVVLALILRER